jgi:hypothetical protein
MSITYYSISGDILICRMYERNGVRKPMPLSQKRFEKVMTNVKEHVQETPALHLVQYDPGWFKPVNNKAYEAEAGRTIDMLFEQLEWTQADLRTFQMEAHGMYHEVRTFIRVFAEQGVKS